MKIGDRVRVNENYSDVFTGKTGTVRKLPDNRGQIYVEVTLDEPIDDINLDVGLFRESELDVLSDR